MLTYIQFLADFPEFATLDEIRFNAMLKRSLLVGSLFLGVDESDRPTAQGLFLAHLLELDNQKSTGNVTAIKKVKSRNDEITYAVGDDPQALDRTSYGQLLTYYLQNSYQGGYLV